MYTQSETFYIGDECADTKEMEFDENISVSFPVKKISFSFYLSFKKPPAREDDSVAIYYLMSDLLPTRKLGYSLSYANQVSHFEKTFSEPIYVRGNYHFWITNNAGVPVLASPGDSAVLCTVRFYG